MRTIPLLLVCCFFIMQPISGFSTKFFARDIVDVFPMSQAAERPQETIEAAGNHHFLLIFIIVIALLAAVFIGKHRKTIGDAFISIYRRILDQMDSVPREHRYPTIRYQRLPTSTSIPIANNESDFYELVDSSTARPE